MTIEYGDVVFTGPASQAQLEHNLEALERGPLRGEELTWVREFGKAARG